MTSQKAKFLLPYVKFNSLKRKIGSFHLKARAPPPPPPPRTSKRTGSYRLRKIRSKVPTHSPPPPLFSHIPQKIFKDQRSRHIKPLKNKLLELPSENLIHIGRGSGGGRGGIINGIAHIDKQLFYPFRLLLR